MKTKPPFWQRSSYCSEQNGCIEVQIGSVGDCSENGCVEIQGGEDGSDYSVRDGKLGDASPVLRFTRSEWAAFVSGVRAGEFGGEGDDSG